jgi:aminoethylphosphonate catabolism LysR family transcriptional regulator
MVNRYFQLRAFDAVAREGSFSKAAAALGLTQPAMTMQVRNLELACRQALFLRAGRRLSLTPAGDELFALSRQMFALEEQVEEYVSMASSFERGSLKLAADSPLVAMQVVAAFHQRYPGIEIAVALGSQRHGWEDVLEHRVDAAILGNTTANERVLQLPLSVQDMMVVLPRDHRLARRRTLSLKDLTDCSLIRREAGSNTQRMVDEAIAQAGLVLPTVLELGSREAIQEAVKLGLGIGFVLEREMAADSRIVGVPLRELRACNTDAVVCLHSQRKRGVVRAFLDVANRMANVGDRLV